MNRAEIAQICEQDVLDSAARLFGSSKAALGKFDDYEGCANLDHYEREGQPRILRLSSRTDRTAELIQAELHFVEYLAEGGVCVSRPVPSINGNLLEAIPAAGLAVSVGGLALASVSVVGIGLVSVSIFAVGWLAVGILALGVKSVGILAIGQSAVGILGIGSQVHAIFSP